MFFQINVTPEARKPQKLSTDHSEPQSVLVLAPFQPQTHINLETTVNSSASTTLLIKNPGNRQLDVKVSKLPPDERKILLNPWTVSIPSESQAELTISWTPKEAGSWRDTLQLIDSRRIKHDIAIITTATQAKKIQTKTKTRILAPTNDNNIQQTFNNNQQSLSSLKCQENKENNCQKRSERKHFDVSSKPTEISGIFDISSYQLTPIKNDNNRVKSTITSDIKFSPGNGITSPNNNHEYQLRRETFVHPNIHHELPSPFDDSDVDPRRETYVNQNPKFCKYKCTTKEVEEEIYDDDYRSYSPEPTTFKATHSDFSMMIDNLANFVTPIKTNRLSINACSTGQKSDTDKSIGNTTFEINSSDVVVNNNETFEYDKSPIRPTSINLQPNKLVDNFGKISPVKGMDSLIIPATPISSSPVSRYQYGENVSVRDVLEADLWVKNQDTAYHHQHQQQQQLQQQASSSVFRSKCNGLDKIIEEQVTFTTQTFTRTLNYSSSNQSAFCFEISPTKRVNIKKSMSIKRSSTTSTSTSIKRISPKKTLKINKEKSILQHSVIKKKSIVNNSIRKSPGGGCTIPPVRIKKLSLAGLNKTVVKPQKKETIVKMYDPNEFIFHNPDPFAATMTEDPFLASTLYYDEKWIFQQEMEFKKWLNELLTPPEHLNTDIDTVKIDIAKVWQSSRLKDNITLAETKEAVSARYHTNTRLNTLRKAALAIFTRAEVRKVLSSTAGLVERGIFVVRQDRDLNRDIGLQKIILELLLSYNPLWLRIGLEVIYGETIPLNSNNDLIGLTKFLLTRFFNDPFIQQKHSHPLTTLKLSSFLPNLNKFIVKKFLLFVYFVDYAKNNKLIGHDPCLFHKKATYKESREILLTFSRETLSGVGDITKILRTHGYIVTQKQTYIDEYDYAVKDLSVDLRDGVRLCRVMELITGLKTLTCRCRVPAISRLQKIHNAELALTALRDSGYIIAGHIDAKAVADGHREKTLSLLWQIIYKFQAPRFSKSAMIIQKWWRSKLWYIKIRNFLKNRKLNAAIVIQCSWRSFKARQLMKTLNNQRQTEIIKKNNAAKIIQACWRQRKIMLKLRHEFLDTQKAVVVIQKWFRRLRVTRPYCQQLEAKKNAIVTIQKHWRATRMMLIEQKKYNNILKSVNLIQLWWRNASASKRQFNNYQKLKTTVLFVQSRWRANKSMKITKSLYMKKQEATKIIQSWWRIVAQMKKVRNNFVIQKSAARIIASWWIRLKLLESQRNEFLNVKKNVIVIQRAWRRHHETKNHVLYFKKVCNSSIVIQTWWRCVKIQNDYKQKRNSAIVIQSWFRAIINKQIAQKNYNSLKKAVVIIQKNWRMKLSKKKYSSMKESALKIQRWYRNIKKSKSIHLEYLAMKKSAVCIQSWWRCLKKTWYYRSKYLEIKNATMVIQNHWRAELLSRKESQEYQRIKMFIIKFQSQLRMVQVQRSYLEKLKRHKAAIIIQRKWRAYKIGTEIKNYYNKQRSAVIIFQRKYRATIAAREAKKTYQDILEIIIKTQRKWRAKKIGKEIQENYIKIHYATLIIERKYRATVKAREVRNEYLKLHKTVVNLQNRWRANKLCKQEQMNYQNIRKSCIYLQANWKMLLARRQFVKQKNAASMIQQKYRATKLACRVQKDYKLLQQLAIKLQKIWRAKKVGRLVLNNYIQ
ncbi:hypothetical protein HCN44_008883 [Aphidius gifuensis]|uniref:Calponin-homology (CH) domain-containing protein n=1 Tax=Aphidius gifuensis TaxID=684658 RepID=A0A834Y1Q2_APHGI|nr:hypothetical protein HCN44_008883 [Aphidius gifuensis]